MVDFSKYADGNHDVSARKCPECGEIYYPVPMVCTRCGARRDPSGTKYSRWEEVKLEGKCRLLTWTRLYNLPGDFTDRYLVFGIVEFEDGVRAAGRVAVERPNSGMALVARTDVVRQNGENVEWGLVFERATPARTGKSRREAAVVRAG